MFESCTNTKETKDELIKIIKKVPLEIVQEHIAKEFYNVDDIVEFLYNSILAGGNGILYGPGGFGKSEITKAFFKFYNITPLVIVGNSGTDIEALLGIPNIKKLTEESIYEIAFENSIFSKAGILIFEEFLDVKPTVAAALKDIITEGGYRRGDEFIPSRVGSMFICSNKAPDEVVIDFSTAAFYKERFPYSKYVIWNNYSREAYLNLFQLKYSKIFDENESEFKLIAELCSSSCNSSSIISPRIAFSAVNLFMLNKDVRVLRMISVIDLSKLNEIETLLNIENQYKHLNCKFSDLTNLVLNLKFDKLSEIASFIAFADHFQKHVIQFNFEGDELLKTISVLNDTISIKRVQANNQLNLIGSKDKLNEIGEIYENIQKFIF
jgi:hypothetical protein